VDGKPVEIFESAGALVSFTVEGEGKHTVELKYMPSVYTLGLIVSFFCGALFLLILILYRYLNKLPILKHVMGIQRPDLPLLSKEPCDAQPGDIGYLEADTPPVREGIRVPSAKELAEIKKNREELGANGETKPETTEVKKAASSPKAKKKKHK